VQNQWTYAAKHCTLSAQTFSSLGLATTLDRQQTAGWLKGQTCQSQLLDQKRYQNPLLLTYRQLFLRFQLPAVVATPFRQQFCICPPVPKDLVVCFSVQARRACSIGLFCLSGTRPLPHRMTQLITRRIFAHLHTCASCRFSPACSFWTFWLSSCVCHSPHLRRRSLLQGYFPRFRGCQNHRLLLSRTTSRP